MKFGLIGERLPHSFSKELHEKIGLYDYRLWEIAPEKLADFMQKRDFSGINVTIPYKQAVIPFLDEISPRAKRIGAVNTVLNKNGHLFGDNTDFGGMEKMIQRAGIPLSGKKVLVAGSGGTSRTALAVAQSLGAEQIFRVSRSGRDDALTYEEAYLYHGNAEILINATPCGMFPNIESEPVDLSRFPKLSGVVDCVYNPLTTCLVRHARERGIPAVNGLYMLVSQAVQAAEIFSGQTLGDDLTDRIYHDILSRKRNIVLTGMPSTGKTVVGTCLSQMLSRKFMDTDDLVLQKTGHSPEDIIRQRGEAAFRDIESEVIAGISPLQGLVIATGGGAALRKKNTDALRANGILIFLDRPLDKLFPQSDRPLSDSKEKLSRLYETRYPIYLKSADMRMDADGSSEETARKIARLFS